MLPPPENVSVPPSVDFAVMSSTTPPPTSVVLLFPPDVLPLRMNVPPLRTSVPTTTALLVSLKVPPLSITSLVRRPATPLTFASAP